MGVYKLIRGGDMDRGDLESVFDENKLEFSSSLSYESANANVRNVNAIRGDQVKLGSDSRLVSLDVFRGLTVLLMIFVDNAGGILPAVNHSPWNGLTLADFVMPFFLFIVGVSLALAYKKVPCKTTATQNAIGRALKLLLVGLFLQGGFFHGINNLSYGVDIGQIRWMGILQRIALAYMFAAACEIWLKCDCVGTTLLKKYQFQWAVFSLLTATYLVLLYGLYVPDWEFESPVGILSAPKKFLVKCGVRGNTGPACNAVGMIDRIFLGTEHLYTRPIYGRTKHCSTKSPDYGPLPADAPSWCQAPFDPEGLLSNGDCHVLGRFALRAYHRLFKEDKKRLLLWVIPSFAMIIVGLTLDFLGMHINKALYTFSYTCVTSGAAGLLFSMIYVVVDACGYRRPTLVLEWIGKHALMIFVLVACNVFPLVLQGFYWRHPQNNIFRLIGIGRNRQQS